MQQNRPPLDQLVCNSNHENCPDRGKPGLGNLSVHETYGSENWCRLKCKTCGGTFTERKGTPFYRMHIPEDIAVKIVTQVSRGGGIRATAETAGVDQNTVMRVVRVMAPQAKAFHEHLAKDIKAEQVQADEIYTFVGEKLATRRRTATP